MSRKGNRPVLDMKDVSMVYPGNHVALKNINRFGFLIRNT